MAIPVVRLFPATPLTPTEGGAPLVRLPVLQPAVSGRTCAPHPGEQLAGVVRPIRGGARRPEAPVGHDAAIPAEKGDPQLLKGAHILFLADDSHMIEVVRTLLAGTEATLVATTEVAEADQYLRGESLPDIFITCYRALGSKKQYDDPDGVVLLNQAIRRREEALLSLLLWGEEGDELARHLDFTHQVGSQTPFTRMPLEAHTEFAERLLNNLTHLMARKELARSWKEPLHFTRSEKKAEDELVLMVRQYIALRRAVHLLWVTLTEPALSKYLEDLPETEKQLKGGAIERWLPKIRTILGQDTQSFQKFVTMDKTAWHNYKSDTLNKAFLGIQVIKNLLVRNAAFKRVREEVSRFFEFYGELNKAAAAIFEKQEEMGNMPFQECDVKRELEEIVRGQGFGEERSQIEVPTELKMTLPEGMLATIVEQFRMNAEHFTPEGSPHPQLMACVFPASEVPKFKGKREEISHYLYLAVANSCGQLLDPQTMKRMFDVSHTTRVNGSGYGLWLARKLLDRVGGTHVIRAAEKLTTIGVYIPIPESTTKT